jgi:hypothetical protein
MSGQQCDLPIEFSPQQGGALAETVTLTDNALNVVGAQQSIDVSGVSDAIATLTSPTPGTTLGTSNITFNWSTGYGVSHYRLYLGINGPGSSDMFVSDSITATSVVVPTLPAMGVTIYARLFSLVASTWHYNDYTFTMTAPVLAAMTSPTPGTTVGTSNVTFNWSPGNLPPHYRLYAGLNGPGSSSLFVMGETSATSVVIPTLPKSGATLYVRLFTLNPTALAWQYNDYTYTLTAP